MSLTDRAQREIAQDLRHSCVVRAPAGSGKTELLVQRALRALLTVPEPEQVLLLTFTNKAVEELRHRMSVLLCHKEGQKEGLVETADLAQKVRQRSEQLGWFLHMSPQRLPIMTLDAYFARLYQRMNPEDHPQMRQLLTDPAQFYEEHIDEALTALLEHDPQTPDLLEIFEGSTGQLRQIFLSLTLSRDRWLSSLYADKVSLSPQECLSAECQILEELSQPVAQEFDNVASFVSQYSSIWPSTLSPASSTYWHCWAQLLLTQKGQWRQSYRRDQGIPAAADLHSWHEPQERTQVLSDLQAIRESFSQHPITTALLRLMRRCPTEHRSIPLSLSHFLRRWVARLEVLKQKLRVMDFIDLTLSVASFFANPETSPALEADIDRNITHLLIDEIQDLSRLQFQIIAALLQKFCFAPQKSAFMVGDPQQAIYHFRGAHIGVFAQFEALDLPGLPKKNCLLQSNFRSAPELVGFVNDWAQKRFGNHSSSWLGVDKALKSYATAQAGGKLSCYSASSVAQEASGLVSIIQRLQKDSPGGSIALLARDRTSLYPLMHLLAHYHIPYDAGDMLMLSQYAFFTDLHALIAIVLEPKQRAHWLPFLRSTWVRASFDDIDKVYHSSAQDFWELGGLQQYAPLFQQDYAQWQQMIHQLMPFKGRSTPARFWDCLWENMGLSQQLEGRERQIWQTVQQYLRQQHWLISPQEILRDLTLFVDKSPAPLPERGRANIMLMTIHKAKGLEFDWVILPNLASRLPTNNRPFLIEVPLDGALFWALNDPQQKEWFTFLDDVVKQQHDHEIARLMYVALTRARRGLILSWNDQKSHQRSFLQMLIGDIPQPQVFPRSSPPISREEAQRKKVIAHWPHWSWQRFSWNTEAVSWESLAPPSEIERVVGLVLHHCLAVLFTRPWPKDLLTKKNLQKLWYRFGGNIEQWPEAFPQIGRSLARIEKSSALDGIFSSEHRQQWSEFSLITPHQHVAHQCRKISIDRLIHCSDGRYWVVEWKTGPAWQQQWPSYREQLLRYACSVEQALGGGFPRISLYVLSDDRLYHWDAMNQIPESAPK